MSIIVNNVTKLYDKQKALNEVSFTINTGEVVGFLGPNGAGKSTMMKIITGFIPQTSGEVYINDANILENSLEIQKKIGYLPENNPLYLDMYIKEYLDFVAGIYNIKKQKTKIINDIIEKVGLSPEIKKKIGALSKGYKQRVGLAQALIHNPDILILDEPTSGLDPNQIIEIRNLISDIGKEKTIMLSTHIMQEVEAICDKIIIIKKGQIITNDSTTSIQNKFKSDYQTLIVEFDKSPNIEKLKSIAKIKTIQKNSTNTFTLQSNTKEDIRPLIFNFAVSNSLTVLSMQEVKKSLEDVFHNLTN